MSNLNKIEYLKSIGCNVDEAINRVLGDVDFYIECVNMFFEDNNLQLISDYISVEDYKPLFAEFHGLKGVVGNLGLTILYDYIYEVVEDLRVGDYTDIKNKYSHFLNLFKRIEKIKEL